MIDIQYIVLLGAIANLAGSFGAIRDILRGKAKPNRVTWLLWSIAPMIATFAALSAGVTWVALPVFMSGFAPFLIFLASFANKKAYWKLTTFDYLCGLFSVLALVLWGITKEPVVAIIFAILADFLAAVPTLKKSWTHPESESAYVYATGIFNQLTAFIAIKTWTFPQYAFSTYIIFICITLLLLIYRKKIFRK